MPSPPVPRVLRLRGREGGRWPDPAGVDRRVMARLAQANAELLVRVLEGEEHDAGDPLIVALATARNLGVVVDDVVRGLALQARRAGHTWAEIGDVLHVTRQAAMQRFGAAVSEPDAPPSRPWTRGARSRGGRMVDHFLAGRWTEMRNGFDPRMLEACSVELLASARASLANALGDRVAAHAPRLFLSGGLTIVDVPLTSERGRRAARVTFDTQGRVAGFFVLHAPAAQPL